MPQDTIERDALAAQAFKWGHRPTALPLNNSNQRQYLSFSKTPYLKVSAEQQSVH